MRVFGFQANSDVPDYALSLRTGDKTESEDFLACGKYPRLESLPGADLGTVTLEDGAQVSAGRKTMRGTWNADLHTSLLTSYTESQKSHKPGTIMHKSKNPRLWNPTSDLKIYLERACIRTLLFAGVNTEQCVMGTMQDTHERGS